MLYLVGDFPTCRLNFHNAFIVILRTILFDFLVCTYMYANELNSREILNFERVVRARLRSGAQQTNEYGLEYEAGRLIMDITKYLLNLQVASTLNNFRLWIIARNYRRRRPEWAYRRTARSSTSSTFRSTWCCTHWKANSKSRVSRRQSLLCWTPSRLIGYPIM